MFEMFFFVFISHDVHLAIESLSGLLISALCSLIFSFPDRHPLHFLSSAFLSLDTLQKHKIPFICSEKSLPIV